MTEGWSEDWVAAHQRKMAAIRPPPGRRRVTSDQPDERPDLPDQIAFSLPLILPLPNTMSGRHWSAHFAQRKRLRPFMQTAIQGFVGCKPMQGATIIVTRYSTGNQRPDTDNLYASAKAIIDLLLLPSKVHPHSFGLIVDDDPERVIPVMRSERCATRKEQRTDVIIERR